MKFWKHSLLATGIFLSIASTVTYTSCNHDSCKALICRNGGTCADEECRCPDGYEGTQCEIKSRDKFFGFYDGITKINDLPVSIDSAKVEEDYENTHVTTIKTFIYSRFPEILRGTVKNNEVTVNAEGNRKVTYKMIGEGRIEILIDETIEGERIITNFQGNKRK